MACSVGEERVLTINPPLPWGAVRHCPWPSEHKHTRAPWAGQSLTNVRLSPASSLAPTIEIHCFCLPSLGFCFGGNDPFFELGHGFMGISSSSFQRDRDWVLTTDSMSPLGPWGHFRHGDVTGAGQRGGHPEVLWGPPAERRSALPWPGWGGRAWCGRAALCAGRPESEVAWGGDAAVGWREEGSVTS